MSTNPQDTLLPVYIGGVEFFVNPGGNDPGKALEWLNRYSKTMLSLINAYGKQSDDLIEFDVADIQLILELVFIVSFAGAAGRPTP